MTARPPAPKPPYLTGGAYISGAAAWHLARSIDRDELSTRLVETGVPARDREATLAALEAIVMAGKEALHRARALRSESNPALGERGAASLELMSATEVAAKLGVTAQQVRNLARDGKLAYARQTSGGRWLIPSASVEAALVNRKDRP